MNNVPGVPSAYSGPITWQDRLERIPSDYEPPQHRYSDEEKAYRKDLMEKIAAGRDPEMEMLLERVEEQEKRAEIQLDEIN